MAGADELAWADEWAGADELAGDCLIGVDVGTTSVKSALFDAAGAVTATSAAPVPTQRSAPGWAEQRAEDWMGPVLAGIARAIEAAPAGAVRAIGLCSQANTHVFVDAHGEALAPAILWQDGRCAAEAAKIDARVDQASRLAWWGAPLPIDASHALSRMAWMARRRPEIWERTRWVMAPKDYCLFKLTGEPCADPLTSFGVVDGNLRVIDELVALVPGAARRLPPLRMPMEVMGRVRTGLPGAGLPVVAGSMDAWVGMIGAGATRDGDAAYLSGTSEVGGIVSNSRTPTPGVIAFPGYAGIMLHAGPTQAGGASVAWLAGLLDRSPEEIAALAALSDRSTPGPIFLPHLMGERAPVWDIDARAAFAGLDATMGARDLARATLEGVAYSVRWLMEALQASSGVTPLRLRHAGGGSRSDIWCQIRADVLGCEIERTAFADSGLLGAAMLAGVGVGMFASLPEAASALSRGQQVFTPDLALRGLYDEGFGRYRELYQRLKGFSGGPR